MPATPLHPQSRRFMADAARLAGCPAVAREGKPLLEGDPRAPLTEAADWLRPKPGLPKGWQAKRHDRLCLLRTKLALLAFTHRLGRRVVKPSELNPPAPSVA